jgi:signal transduction histidine kinase
MDDEQRFARIVSIACHDLRTPLAVIYGFGQTLGRSDLGETEARYIEMIKAGTSQMTELLDELSLVARIETGRYDPPLVDADSLELGRKAASDLEERVEVSGEGATVRADPEVTARSISRLAKAATRHGGVDSVALVVRGTQLEISPVKPHAAGVVLGEDLRELGAVSAVEHLQALGASLEVEGERLLIRLVPAESSSSPS